MDSKELLALAEKMAAARAAQEAENAKWRAERESAARDVA